jgi:hypothetical protein
MYVKIVNVCVIIIALYVDDILMLYNDVDETHKVKEELMTKSRMKEVREAKQVLGMKIRRKSEEIYVDQSKYWGAGVAQSI